MSPTGTLRSVSLTLAALAEIAEALASDEPLDDVISDILATVERVVDADECAVWLDAPEGLTSAWSVGKTQSTAHEVESMLEHGIGERGRLVIAPLRAGGRRLGAIAARLRQELPADERLFLATVANLVAPVLTHAERSHRLAVEVATRTRQIEEQRRFTQRIIDSLPVGLYVVDREYRVQAWNRKRETGMQGVSREEAIGRTIFEILHRQPADLLRQEFDDVFRSGRMQEFTTESSTSGEVRTYRISKIPMRLEDNRVTHVITIGEDVTEWKEAQERFAQAEKLAAIGTLAAGVMHEINNPLATITACAEALLFRFEDLRAAGTVLPAEATEYLKIVDVEVQRCKRIVDGLLDFSRPKSSVKRPLNLNDVIEQAIFLLKHHARFKKLHLELELDPTLGESVEGNSDQLVQVFIALLLNAMDAMEERGTIGIRTGRLSEPMDLILAEVIDRGHGIPRAELSKIFEPFYTTKPPGRGTGLGLSICYGIIAEHGGRMEVDSAPGAGSTFRIVLPPSDA